MKQISICNQSLHANNYRQLDCFDQSLRLVPLVCHLYKKIQLFSFSLNHRMLWNLLAGNLLELSLQYTLMLLKKMLWKSVK